MSAIALLVDLHRIIIVIRSSIRPETIHFTSVKLVIVKSSQVSHIIKQHPPTGVCSIHDIQAEYLGLIQSLQGDSLMH